jgi:hypothetical protein
MDQRVTTLIEQLKQAVEESNQLRKILGTFQERTARTDGLDQLRSLVKEFAQEAGRLVDQHAGTVGKSLNVAEDLGRDTGETPAIPPSALVDQIRTMIDNVHEDVRRGRDSESASTLRSVDVELKGLIVVEQDQAQIVPPHPERPIDPGQLSTIRMSFGAVPVARPVTPAEPGIGEQPPARPRRRRPS